MFPRKGLPRKSCSHEPSSESSGSGCLSKAGDSGTTGFSFSPTDSQLLSRGHDSVLLATVHHYRLAVAMLFADPQCVDVSFYFISQQGATRLGCISTMKLIQKVTTTSTIRVAAAPHCC
ncbi:hypothetical protein CR513_44922, partial [Mucuna pruriens]